MGIRLHNTLSRKLDEFIPTASNRVKMFVCGPTVYDFIHIGNAKTFTQFDVIARTLRYVGYELTYIQNITDIDDKIIWRSTEKNVAPQALAEEYESHFLADMLTLNNTSVSKYAKAHDYLPQIVSQVERLLTNGYAYKISDGIYFNTKKDTDYGKLSGRTALEASDAVSRIDENPEKMNPGDFCLWKFKKDGDPSWPAPIGEGRPGWHIEDTAITESELGEQYDLHGGAMDLIFPHHEAEIAQMESISGRKPFVKYWLHTGFLNINTEKMSKSLGNFSTVRDILESGVPPMALRYLFVSGQYRSQMGFTPEALAAAESAYRRLKTLTKMFREKSERVGKTDEKYKKEFVEALENDFNTPEALAVVWKMVKLAGDGVSYVDAYTTLLDFDQVLGLKLDETDTQEIPPEVQNLLDERAEARNSKDFTKADKIREEIKALGYLVEDKNSGQEVRKM